MSQDFQLSWPCPHMTMEEVVILGSDRRSMPTRQPVAGAGTVRILVNNEIFIPQAGLYSVAQLYSSLSGPYDVTEGEDTLTITSPRGSETFSFGATGTVRLSTDQIIKELLKKNLSVVLAENSNGHLLFSDTSTVGLDSFVQVGGVMAATLGFGAGPCATVGYQYRAQGKQVYPGWVLASRPDTISNRYPKFNSSILGNPMLKVTYSVPVQRCLRCKATYIENDFRFTEDGKSLLIQDENLLYQAALKILLTDQGSNPYHSWYGTTLRSRIGTKALSGIAAILSDDVRQGLGRLQSLQEDQAQYQTVTFKERLYSVVSVDVYPHNEDPTTYLIDVVVQNASGEPIELSIVFTVPDVVALMGSNGLMLGTEAAGLGASVIAVPNGARLLTDGS